jgi:hypothetical protein
MQGFRPALLVRPGEEGQSFRLAGLPCLWDETRLPPKRGVLVRGVPTAAAAEPLKSHFVDNGEPPPVWPYSEGSVRGLSFSPLYKNAPKAALLDSRLYELLALCDAIRSGRTRERVLAVELLRKALNA